MRPAAALCSLAVAVAYLACFSVGIAVAEADAVEVGERLRARIEAAGAGSPIIVGEETIHASVVLPRFYERRAYRPAWTDGDGSSPMVDGLIGAIDRAYLEGLAADDYHQPKIATLVASTRRDRATGSPLRPERLADLDLLLTDAFLIYGSHLLAGRVDPVTFDAEWHADRRQRDLADVLESALQTGRIEEALQKLLPDHRGYGRLRSTLAKYREAEAEGAWPYLEAGPPLRLGDEGSRVDALRRRLAATGDLPEGSAETDGFDETLDEALRRFQRRHGLDPDAIVGPATLAALNVPIAERIRQIALNLERWRWLPEKLGTRYVLVNIANFELDVVEGDELVMAMRVVVGRDYRRTPVFSDEMTYLVLSPYWNVPSSIAVKDKLPLIRKDPRYLAQQHMRVFRGWGADAVEVDPSTIDWSKMTAASFRYRLRQDPGPLNALGRVKFMFPNPFDVYLHDTPSPELFSRAERAFSSGCIRIEKPIELAEYVLGADPQWTRDAILAAIERGVERTVKLPAPIPVHLLYWTAWAGEVGEIHFRRDIYGRDGLLAEALAERPGRVAR